MHEILSFVGRKGIAKENKESMVAHTFLVPIIVNSVKG